MDDLPLSTGSQGRPGPVLPDRFTLPHWLGAGGMGQVYRALDRSLQRMVAVKTLHPHFTEDGRVLARFAREARAQAQIDHPNVVKIFHADIHSKTPFLVMEYIEGESLEKRLKRAPGLDPECLYRLAQEIAGALDALHQEGILHRDLKPANVMIRKEDSSAVVMDLGLASILDSTQLTMTGELLGTPLFLPPETLSGGTWAPASDQYQLAAILFEAASGIKPFSARSQAQLFSRIVDGKVSPWPAPEKVPQAIRSAIERGLQVNPEDRFPNCQDLARALKRRSPRPISPVAQSVTPPPSGDYPVPEASTNSRRHRGLIALLILFNGLLVLALFWTSRSEPVRDVRYQVLGDTLLVEFSGGGPKVKLRVGEAEVSDAVPLEGGRRRILFQGLPSDREAPARLTWPGGKDTRSAFRAGPPAISPRVRLGPRLQIGLEVHRSILLRPGEGLAAERQLPEGICWIPAPGFSRAETWNLSWEELGIEFSHRWAPLSVLEEEVQRLLRELEDNDPLETQRARAAASAQEDGPSVYLIERLRGVRDWIPVLLDSPLPVPLRRRLLAVWQTWDRTVAQSQALGDQLEPLALEGEVPGAQIGLPLTWPSLARRTPEIHHLGTGNFPEGVISITNEIGRTLKKSFSGGILAHFAPGARFEWPSAPVPGDSLLALTFDLASFQPDTVLEIHQENGAAGAFRARLWADPLQVLPDQRLDQSLTLVLPGDLAPAPGTRMRIVLRHLLHPRPVRARIRKLVLSWRPREEGRDP